MAVAVGVVKTASPPPFCRSQTHLVLPRSARVIGRPAGHRQTVFCSVSSPIVEGEPGTTPEFTRPEVALIEALLGVQGRGRSATRQQLENVERSVKALEDAGGVPDPTSSGLIEGRWQLIFTTRPGTASPIQRTFVGVDIFKVFQEICLWGDDPRVSNIVQFSDTVGELKVEAVAAIKDGRRILFRFDRAAFSFKFLPFKVPYPVPFRLLGDEAKGWLDTTYLSYSGNLRISRGNKGTTFVLQKTTEPRQKLLSAISAGTMVEEAIYEFLSLDLRGSDEECELYEGEWQLVWTSRVQEESITEQAAVGLKGLQIIKKNSELENVVNLFPGVQVCSKGKLMQGGKNFYDVKMSEGLLKVAVIQIPLSIRKDYKMELLYTDKKIRISKVNEVTFVHVYVEKSKKGL